MCAPALAAVRRPQHTGRVAPLRGANAKFERRFAAMEAEAGDAFAGLNLEEKEARWQAVKRSGG